MNGPLSRRNDLVSVRWKKPSTRYTFELASQEPGGDDFRRDASKLIFYVTVLIRSRLFTLFKRTSRRGRFDSTVEGLQRVRYENKTATKSCSAYSAITEEKLEPK